MSTWLGSRRRKMSRKALERGYLEEYEDTWNDECTPPGGRDCPLLSDDTLASHGTQWRCPACNTVWKVVVPDPKQPYVRSWVTSPPPPHFVSTAQTARGSSVSGGEG